VLQAKVARIRQLRWRGPRTWRCWGPASSPGEAGARAGARALLPPPPPAPPGAAGPSSRSRSGRLWAVTCWGRPPPARLPRAALLPLPQPPPPPPAGCRCLPPATTAPTRLTGCCPGGGRPGCRPGAPTALGRHHRLCPPPAPLRPAAPLRAAAAPPAAPAPAAPGRLPGRPRGRSACRRCSAPAASPLHPAAALRPLASPTCPAGAAAAAAPQGGCCCCCHHLRQGCWWWWCCRVQVPAAGGIPRRGPRGPALLSRPLLAAGAAATAAAVPVGGLLRAATGCCHSLPAVLRPRRAPAPPAACC
jgi:hypothetical protein